MVEIIDALERLLAAYGPRGWWPLPSLAGTPGRDADGYSFGPSSPIGLGGSALERSLRFEVAVGAVLAQNTAWIGAERAVRALAERGALSPEGMLGLPVAELMPILRPAGTFRIKAGYLRNVASAWRGIGSSAPEREDLLAIPGIGYETADCILLYGFGVPVFIADAYARRTLSRLGLAASGDGYERVRRFAEASLPSGPEYLCEAHALLVEHAKRHCRARPNCDACPLASGCARAMPM